MVLGELNYPLGPLLASAGVVGVALGIGCQSLVRDFVSGIFIILEDQYGVGDVVDVGEVSGTVEAVNLRVTRMRDVDGTVWYVRNGEILRVGNQSQGWSRAVLDITVANDEDIARARELLLRRRAQPHGGRGAYANLVHRRARGVGHRAAVRRTRSCCGSSSRPQPLQQWTVARELRRRIKETFQADRHRVASASTSSRRARRMRTGRPRRRLAAWPPTTSPTRPSTPAGGDDRRHRACPTRPCPSPDCRAARAGSRWSPASPATSAAGWCPSCWPRAGGCAPSPGTRSGCATGPGRTPSRSSRRRHRSRRASRDALDGVHVAYYLIHAIGSGTRFASLDRRTALHVRPGGARGRRRRASSTSAGSIPTARTCRRTWSPARRSARSCSPPACRRRCCARPSSSARARRRSRCCATSPSACR